MSEEKREADWNKEGKTRRQLEEEKETEREKERSNATKSLHSPVGSSEKAHGLGRRCGVIQSRFRPMNFLYREEGEPAGRPRVHTVGKTLYQSHEHRALRADD